MRTTIRRATFETNSSSAHALCVMYPQQYDAFLAGELALEFRMSEEGDFFNCVDAEQVIGEREAMELDKGTLEYCDNEELEKVVAYGGYLYDDLVRFASHDTIETSLGDSDERETDRYVLRGIFGDYYLFFQRQPDGNVLVEYREY